MPELPEVETIVGDLNKKIKGDTIVNFWSSWPKAIKNKKLKKFQQEIKNRKILNARRIGKNIFIDLDNNKTLYIHLKMTGHLLVKLPNEFGFQNSNSKSILNKQTKTNQHDYFNDKVNQYIRHIFYLKSKNSKFKFRSDSNFYNKTLEFSDVRKFAKIILDHTAKINTLTEIKNLGIDALDKNFTLEKFEKILNKQKNKIIGDFLIDQKFIAGIGNIYRSEILFAAKVFPLKRVRELKKKEIESIYKNIKIVLKKAIKLRGTSDSDYRDTAGAPGKFQKVLKVYQKNGHSCLKCATIIKRLIFKQRSIFYCPQCQL